MRPQLACFVPLILLASCASGPAAELRLAPDPAEAFAQIEQRLVDAHSLTCQSEIRASGTVTAELTSLHRVVLDQLRIEAEGKFLDQPVTMSLESDGDSMQLRVGERRVRDVTPSDLHQGVLLGLTRMGWLHNLAVLSAGSPPEFVDGSAARLLQVANFREEAPRDLDGIPMRGIAFDLSVAGDRVADVVLWVDPATGLPVERQQRVQFPEGEMQVIERYLSFEVLDKQLATN